MRLPEREMVPGTAQGTFPLWQSGPCGDALRAASCGHGHLGPPRWYFLGGQRSLGGLRGNFHAGQPAKGRKLWLCHILRSRSGALRPSEPGRRRLSTPTSVPPRSGEGGRGRGRVAQSPSTERPSAHRRTGYSALLSAAVVACVVSASPATSVGPRAFPLSSKYRFCRVGLRGNIWRSAPMLLS